MRPAPDSLLWQTGSGSEGGLQPFARHFKLGFAHPRHALRLFRTVQVTSLQIEGQTHQLPVEIAACGEQKIMQARENKLTKVPSQVQVACASSSVRPQAGMRHIMALISCRGSFLFNFSNLAVSNRRLLSGSEEHRQLGAHVASGRVACAGAAELHAHEASRTKPGPSGATRSLTVSGPSPRLPLTTHWQSSMGLSQPAAACGFNLSVRVQPLPHTNGTGSVNIPLALPLASQATEYPQ